MLPEELLIIVRLHAAALQEQPQLPPSLMLEVVELLELLGELHHAGRVEALPEGFHVLEVELELAVEDGGVVEVGGVERVQGLADEGADLVLGVRVQHFYDRSSHPFQFVLQEGRVQVDHQISGARVVEIDVSSPHEAKPLAQADLAKLQWNHSEFLWELILLMRDLGAEDAPILLRDVELVDLHLHEEGEDALQQLHVPHPRLDVARQPALQLDAEDEFLHLHELAVVGVVVAVEHAADEMRDQVLPLRALLLELAQQVHVELPLLLRGRQLRVLVDPALVAAQGSDLLLTQGLELLVEVDAPGGEADHLVAGGLVRQRVHVDEGCELLVGYAAHFRAQFYIITRAAPAT